MAARRKWVQVKGLGLIEVDPSTYTPVDGGALGVEQPQLGAAAYYFGDSHMDGMRSPIDGADISTRTKLREHMHRHGVGHFDELKQDVERYRKESIREYEASRKRDLVEAVQRVSSGYKPHIQREEY